MSAIMSGSSKGMRSYWLTAFLSLLMVLNGFENRCFAGSNEEVTDMSGVKGYAEQDAGLAAQVCNDNQLTSTQQAQCMEEFGGGQDCDTDCQQVFQDADNTCNSGDTTNCNAKKQSQIYTQCVAYRQAGWSAFFDTYMMWLDLAAGAACTAACVLMVADPFAAATNPTVIACGVAATVDGAGSVANSMALNILMGQSFMGTGTQGKISTALGVAGIVMGAGGLVDGAL